MDELTLWKDQQLKRLKRDLDSLYARMFYDFCTPLFDVMGEPPLLHVRQDRRNIYVTADIPDLNPEDLEVSIDDGILAVRGKTVEETGQGERRIMSSRSFSARLRLPSVVDASKVDARYTQGVLTLVMPKHKKPQSKRISITQG